MINFTEWFTNILYLIYNFIDKVITSLYQAISRSIGCYIRLGRPMNKLISLLLYNKDHKLALIQSYHAITIHSFLCYPLFFAIKGNYFKTKVFNHPFLYYGSSYYFVVECCSNLFYFALLNQSRLKF